MNFFKQKIINTEEASEAEKSVTEKNSDENRTEPAAPPQEEVQGIKRVMVSYDVLLPEIQAYMSSQYASTVYDMDRAEMFRNYIKQYLIDKNYYIEGKTLAQAVEMLYSDMAEFSVLTSYLKRTDIEEINVNSWDDIEIRPSGGDSYKAKETFKSPEHCIDIIKRLLHDQEIGRAHV